MQHILFICSANKDRSKTAEDYFPEKYPNLNFDSAGKNQKTCFQLGTNFIELDQLDLADSIYVMETKYADFINQFSERKYRDKIDIFYIKDIYTYNQKKIITLFSDKFKFINR